MNEGQKLTEERLLPLSSKGLFQDTSQKAPTKSWQYRFCPPLVQAGWPEGVNTSVLPGSAYVGNKKVLLGSLGQEARDAQ